MMTAGVNAFPYGSVIARVLIYSMSDSGSKYITIKGASGAAKIDISSLTAMSIPYIAFAAPSGSRKYKHVLACASTQICPSFSGYLSSPSNPSFTPYENHRCFFYRDSLVQLQLSPTTLALFTFIQGPLFPLALHVFFHTLAHCHFICPTVRLLGPRDNPNLPLSAVQNPKCPLVRFFQSVLDAVGTMEREGESDHPCGAHEVREHCEVGTQRSFCE